MPRRTMAAMLCGLILWPASAAASGPSTIYGQVLHIYQSGGSIPPCQFTSPQLASALSSVDTYGQQYYADFIAAIQSALAARASGVCSKTTKPATSPAGGPVANGPPVPVSVTASSSSGVPAPLVALGIASALLACLTGLSAVPRRRVGASDWEHGWAETRYHLSTMWDALVGPRRRQGP